MTHRRGLLRIHGDTMKKPRPKGLETFDRLIGKLAKVPKRELNSKIRKQRKGKA